MAVNAVTTFIASAITIDGFQSRGSISVSGLTVGANVVPHGCPFAPRALSFRPGANARWGETQAPDATNIYITVGAGGALAGLIDFEE